MAKSSVIDTAQADDGEFQPLLRIQDDTQNAWDDWGEALAGTDSPGEVRCYRLPIDPTTGKPSNAQGQQEYLCKVPFDQYTFDSLLAYLREAFMDPDEKFMAVRIAGFKKGERGNKFSRVVVIRQDRLATKHSSAAPAASNSSAESIMRTMQEMMAKQLQTVQSLQPSAPGTSNVDTFTKLAAALGPFMLPFITAMAARMTAPAPAPPPGANLKDQLETLVMLRDIAGGGGGEDSSMLGLLKAVGPSALQAFGQIAQQRALLSSPPRPNLPELGSAPAPAPAPAPVPNPRPPLTSTAPAATPTQGTSMNMQQLTALLNSLIDHAKAGSDPKDVAIAMLDTMSDVEGDELATRLADERALDQLAMFYGDVQTYRPWFDQLRAAILAEYEQDAPTP